MMKRYGRAIRKYGVTSARPSTIGETSMQSSQNIQSGIELRSVLMRFFSVFIGSFFLVSCFADRVITISDNAGRVVWMKETGQ